VLSTEYFFSARFRCSSESRAPKRRRRKRLANRFPLQARGWLWDKPACRESPSFPPPRTRAADLHTDHTARIFAVVRLNQYANGKNLLGNILSGEMGKVPYFGAGADLSAVVNNSAQTTRSRSASRFCAAFEPNLDAIEIKIDDELVYVRTWLSARPPTIGSRAVGAAPTRCRDRTRAECPRASPPPSSSGSGGSAAGRLRGSQRSAACDGRVRPRWQIPLVMPFFLTMPIKRMMPMIPITDRSMWPNCSTSNAPTPADSNEDRMVNGWMKLL
jgi:hypothetical protein